MNYMVTMPDTRNFWKAKVHNYVRANGVVKFSTIKELFPELENPLNRKTKWGHLKSFLDSKWFRRDCRGHYTAESIWHDSRYFQAHEGKRRKDDIEYAICSLLQNYPELTSMGITERVQLRSNREPHGTHISRICQLSKFISPKGNMWVFNYSIAGYGA